LRVADFSELEDGARFDFVVIGSGFGGSVSALRLAEKGYSVCVLEAGRHFRDSDFAKSNWHLAKTFWMPRFLLRGIMRLTLLKDVLILSGAGVGGGSLVYANTLLEPGDRFYDSEPAQRLAPDLRERLRPHYATAKRMLGVAKVPRLFPADETLRELAHEAGRGETFHAADVGVYFGEPGKTAPDPYFGGEGPERAGCVYCGACMVGCRHNAKNTLAKNYLHLASKKGARIFALSEVKKLDERGAGFALTVGRPGWGLKRRTIEAANVVVSAGVLGTMRLLLSPKNALTRLPKRLGRDVRTNSEAILGAVDLQGRKDYSQGLAITAGYWPDEHTHIEAVRYPEGSDAMSLLSLPRGKPGLLKRLRLAWPFGWAKTTTILLVMQTLDTRLRLALKGCRLQSEPEPGSAAPARDIPVADQALSRFCEKTGSEGLVSAAGALLNVSTTAHILGGAVMARGPEEGVTGLDGKVFGYDNLWVLDGSSVPANLGVNPSLTITALAEHAMAQVPGKS
jgi:cholesterol oxidase